MNNDIYRIRENEELYIFLKYNSNLYKRIFRKEISVKELEKIFKTNSKKTSVDKINKIKDKMELANTFFEILK